jgi:GR25 family glycosyltransferase involved in LPS biosynthesis
MKENLVQYGLPFEIIRAIDSDSLKVDQIENLTTEWCSAHCTKSMIAISLSHMKVWQKISQSNYKWHLVLEDDIHFTDESIAYLKELETIQHDIPDVFILNMTNHRSKKADKA